MLSAGASRNELRPGSVPTQDAGAASTAFVAMSGVSKAFTGRGGSIQALNAIDLAIPDGEFVSIIGPSGCGKSTLIMLVAGLMAPSAGTIMVGRRRIDGPNADLGIVFQHDVLLDWRTALDNILLQAEIRGHDRTRAADEARRLLAMVGLEAFAAAYPYELSGGMRQRVAICRALLHRPPLLLMDEPFGALDAISRDQLQVDLLRLWSQQRMTVLFITHSIREAVFLSDRVVVMSPHPGHIETVIPINLPRPRRLVMRDGAEFARYDAIVTDIFRSLGVLREAEDEP
jgi:NitT/TauT family transport system ATP-binding protein